MFFRQQEMRCKIHSCDVSSGVGVCATCLRERLSALITAQTQIEAQLASAVKSDHIPPPRRRKSDDVSSAPNKHHNRINSQFDHRFHSTPQVGPTNNAINGPTNLTSSRSCRRKSGSGKFSVWSNIFSKSRSRKSKSDHNVPCGGDRPSSSAPSLSWFSSIFTRRKKQSQLFTVEESIGNQGMSPDEDHSPSVSDQTSESSQGWKSTPTVAPPSSARRSRPCHVKSGSGLAVCLSPLVRASPNRHWNQKSGVLTSEMAYSGELRGSSKPNLGTASYCGNRSRKIVDFGRVNHNR